MPGLLPADADVAFRPNVFCQAFKLSKLAFCNIKERSEYSYIRLGDFFFRRKCKNLFNFVFLVLTFNFSKFTSFLVLKGRQIVLSSKM